MPSQLPAFLLARISEDEAAARAVPASPWTLDDEQCCVGCDGHDGTVVSMAFESAPYIARFQPSRVLAECEAKRRIIHIHSDWIGDGGCTGCGFGSDEERMNTVDDCPTLHALARPFAAHPDFQVRWNA